MVVEYERDDHQKPYWPVFLKVPADTVKATYPLRTKNKSKSRTQFYEQGTSIFKHNHVLSIDILSNLCYNGGME